MTRVIGDALLKWSTNLLCAGGLSQADAEEISRHLVFCDLRGVDTHGTSRLKIYLDRMQAGAIRNSTPAIERETGVSAVVDGRAGFGQVICRFATDLAIEKAKEVGMAAVAVKNSNHCGAMSYYTLLMARSGLAGFAVTNSNPAMPPFGGRDGFFGTNPLSFAFPAGEEEPLVTDMATSLVAKGKIINLAREGKPVPEGWAVTLDGRPTTDPKEALEGWVTPMAGPKGSGLAMVVDVLGAVVPGALLSVLQANMYGPGLVPQENGQFFWAFRPDLFRPEQEFRATMDDLIRRVRAVAPAPGQQRVYAPGDVERMREEENARIGIPVPPGQLREFIELGDRFGVPFPLAN